MKEFPSGNKATSTSRKKFLRSLCKLRKFQDLVDLIPPVVRFFKKYVYVNLFFILAKLFAYSKELPFVGGLE